MIFEQRVTVAAPREDVWDFLMDVPSVVRCVPGVESFEKVDEDNYTGTIKVRVGPIVVRLEGKATITERDQDAWLARGRMEAADKRVKGWVSATSTLQLEAADQGTDLQIHTDAAVLGKLGEFGQPIIRRKADQILAEFGRNLAREIAAKKSGG